ncbi:unnamed protein product [Aureobasidium pullulans]|nr:unnamed protein product [Aureobasidium pullulans]
MLLLLRPLPWPQYDTSSEPPCWRFRVPGSSLKKPSVRMLPDLATLNSGHSATRESLAASSSPGPGTISFDW